MNVYRFPPAVLPSLVDHRAHLAALRSDLGATGYLSQHTIRVCYPALDAALDDAVREDEAQRRAARAPAPWTPSPSPRSPFTFPGLTFDEVAGAICKVLGSHVDIAPGRLVHG